MAKNKMEDLRNLLFMGMESLLDPESKFTKEQAQALADLGQVMVNSMKVEVDFLKINDGVGTGFIPVDGEVVKDKLLN